MVVSSVPALSRDEFAPDCFRSEFASGIKNLGKLWMDSANSFGDKLIIVFESSGVLFGTHFVGGASSTARRRIGQVILEEIAAQGAEVACGDDGVGVLFCTTLRLKFDSAKNLIEFIGMA